jgi:hypothetical protein
VSLNFALQFGSEIETRSIVAAAAVGYFFPPSTFKFLPITRSFDCWLSTPTPKNYKQKKQKKIALATEVLPANNPHNILAIRLLVDFEF